jgi:predicted nucleic acid-binding protein
MIVLDTNVISEALKPDPSAEILRWLALEPGSTLYTTAITQAELLYGVELMPMGKRRSALHAAITKILTQIFAGRILPFDSAAAEAYAELAASRRAMGRPISEADAQIAAIARSHGASLATRNARDFEHCGIKVLNPWGASRSQ